MHVTTLVILSGRAVSEQWKQRAFRCIVHLGRILITATGLRKVSGASFQMPKMTTLSVPVTTAGIRSGIKVFQTVRRQCSVIKMYRSSCSDTYNGYRSAIGERGIILNAQNDHFIHSCDYSFYQIGPCSIAIAARSL